VCVYGIKGAVDRKSLGTTALHQLVLLHRPEGGGGVSMNHLASLIILSSCRYTESKRKL
jgi:hypothetical protein